MSPEFKQRIAVIFQRNMDNRLSVELSNGMLQNIFDVIEKELEEMKKELNLEGPEDGKPAH